MMLKNPLFNRKVIHIPRSFGGKMQYNGWIFHKKVCHSGILSILCGKYHCFALFRRLLRPLIPIISFLQC